MTSLDDRRRAYDILRTERRRVLLHVIDDAGGEGYLSDLAGEVADREGCSRKNAYIGCYQTHLPQLDEYGAVEYDQRSGWVKLTSYGERVLTFDGRAEQFWSTSTWNPVRWAFVRGGIVDA